jgi:SP family general alpha glucoside:H+ symporter-like MFS transporter
MFFRTVGVALQITPWSYGPVIGPSMAMAGEVSSARLRAKSLAIGTAFNYLASTVWTIVLPYLFNSDEANLGGKVGFIFFGMALLALVVLFYDAPETKGRSFGELDVLFDRKVGARKFKGYDVGGEAVELVKT